MSLALKHFCPMSMSGDTFGFSHDGGLLISGYKRMTSQVGCFPFKNQESSPSPRVWLSGVLQPTDHLSYADCVWHGIFPFSLHAVDIAGFWEQHLWISRTEQGRWQSRRVLSSSTNTPRQQVYVKQLPLKTTWKLAERIFHRYRPHRDIRQLKWQKLKIKRTIQAARTKQTVIQRKPQKTIGWFFSRTSAGLRGGAWYSGCEMKKKKLTAKIPYLAKVISFPD